MIALVDCNSFFCSVEKVFHPGLNGKPVCVLSCNDGCIIALTPEAKALGLRRGDPIFKEKEVVEQYGVKLFSTNMMLYAAMSKRVNNILRSSVPRSETYSIDESFLYLDGLEKYYNLEDYMRRVVEKVRLYTDIPVSVGIPRSETYSIDESFLYLDGLEKYYNLEDYMRRVVEKVRLYTDIPVSVGIASTKTLAKVGSRFAKQYKGYRSVCMIDSEEKRRKALELVKLAEVWGIGKQTLAKLNYLGITTPLEFADKKESWVRGHFAKPGVQIWKELNGIPCIDTAEVAQRQTICISRSFGSMVTDYGELQASVASFAASCANKLRGQHSLTSAVTVFVSSNRFREDLPLYANEQTRMLFIPTSDTIEITQAALAVLKEIYREGICYKKAGVILGHITDASCMQQHLFDEVKNRNLSGRYLL